jgi:hypothetical protein
VVSVDAHVQTDDHDFLDDRGTTDERITRLKRRCKALESLLDKKFEDSSAGSVESGISGRWSSRSERRGDVVASGHGKMSPVVVRSH